MQEMTRIADSKIRFTLQPPWLWSKVTDISRAPVGGRRRKAEATAKPD
jgi:hypothetical protein